MIYFDPSQLFLAPSPRTWNFISLEMRANTVLFIYTLEMSQNN